MNDGLLGPAAVSGIAVQTRAFSNLEPEKVIVQALLYIGGDGDNPEEL